MVCKKCGGDCQILGEEYVGRVVRQKTSMNINPLHPLTIANTKEVVKNEGIPSIKWVCTNCSNTFYTSNAKTADLKTLLIYLSIGVIIVLIFLGILAML